MKRTSHTCRGRRGPSGFVRRVGLPGTALIALLGGCALVTPGDEASTVAEDASAPADLRTVTDELAAVFLRVDELGPDRVAPGVLTRDDPAFTEALEASLRDAGYRLDPSSPDAPTPVTYSIQSEGDTVTATVGMGGVQARRSYRGSLQAASPAGPLYVRGIDATALQPSAEVAAIEAPASVPSLEPPEPPPSSGPVDTAESTGRTPEIRTDGAGGAPALGGLVSRALDDLDEPDTVRNVMSIGDTNFADLFVDYRTVNELIMVFPNDSQRLGDDNKALMAAEVERFRPDTDMFAVVGCSLGPTKLSNGNEVLALGRANRVVEELVGAGVPSSRIVDEGCWAGEASARFPSRGVVLTLKRQAGLLDS